MLAFGMLLAVGSGLVFDIWLFCYYKTTDDVVCRHYHASDRYKCCCFMDLF